MLPPAPALLSTRNCWPGLSVSLAATMRAIVSLAPPGACGTMIVTGLLGYLSCANGAAGGDGGEQHGQGGAAGEVHGMSPRGGVGLVWAEFCEGWAEGGMTGSRSQLSRLVKAPALREQPGLGGAAPRLVGADALGALQRQGDVVQPLQQALLARGVDVEGDGLAAVGRDRLRRQIDAQLQPRRGGNAGEQRFDRRGGQHDRQQPVLEAVAEEDVGEAGRDQRTDAEVAQRPDRMLAARAAAEVLARQQDRAPAKRGWLSAKSGLGRPAAGPGRARRGPGSATRRTGCRRSRCAGSTS